jgi:hypothetical protein
MDKESRSELRGVVNRADGRAVVDLARQSSMPAWTALRRTTWPIPDGVIVPLNPTQRASP